MQFSNIRITFSWRTQCSCIGQRLVSRRAEMQWQVKKRIRGKTRRSNDKMIEWKNMLSIWSRASVIFHHQDLADMQAWEIFYCCCVALLLLLCVCVCCCVNWLVRVIWSLLVVFYFLLEYERFVYESDEAHRMTRYASRYSKESLINVRHQKHKPSKMMMICTHGDIIRIHYSHNRA